MSGLKVSRFFTKEGIDPYDLIEWETRNAVIPNHRGGGNVFEQREVEFPKSWSQNATNIAAQKYFAGHIGSSDREFSLKQETDRIVNTITEWAWNEGRFAAEADREVFRDELKFINVTQRATWNSPVHFNIGVPGFVPQASACFILKVDDSMESILNWYVEEGLIFKGGSGAGVNLSRLRSSKEKIAGRGESSGPVTFMRAADANAGTIKSGGKTRRAAKMVILDAWHPDVLDFVWCKALEERKKRALAAAGFDMDLDGRDSHSIQYQNANNSVRVTDDFMRAYLADDLWDLRAVLTEQTLHKLKARDMMRQITQAAWECADPGLQYDTTINLWHTAPAAGRINASNPCSEYMHLDNSPCNLASINLIKFFDEDGRFDVEAFKHTVRVLLLSQATLAVWCEYPTDAIARNARGFRELGIGHANIGGSLMQLGLAYDSDAGRHWAGAITSLMQAVAARASAEFASVVGPYPGNPEDKLPGYEHQANKKATMSVMKMHRAFARTLVSEPTLDDYALVPDVGYVDEHGVSKKFNRLDIFRREIIGGGITANADPALAQVAEAAVDEWDTAIELGEQFGYENSQLSVMAPTGTIGLYMDCDTTGIEPDLALVKTKKLVGGGSMKIVNQSVPTALSRLGYGELAIDEVTKYIGEHKTVIGAPHVRAEHYPVFACSITNDNLISYEGHIKMMAAVQPFISGAISKTINMASDATPEDIERVYYEGWRYGLKALAIYRDNSKGDQPLNMEERTVKVSDIGNAEEVIRASVATLPKREFLKRWAADFYSKYHPGMDVSVPSNWGEKRKLQSTVPAFRHTVNIRDARGKDHQIFFILSLFPDGTPGEIFIAMQKIGWQLRGVMDSFGIAISKAFKLGLAVDEVVEVFGKQRFEPSGLTNNPDIRIASSSVSYLAEFIGTMYMETEELEVFSINTRAVRAKKAALLGAPIEPVDVFPEDSDDNGSYVFAPFSTTPVLGVACDECGSPNLKDAGSCAVCEDCGATTGCS